MSDLQFKPCSPRDVNEAIPLIYSSGPPTFEYVFQNDTVNAQDFLRFAFCRQGGEFSYDNHHGLYDGDKLVGIGARFSKKEAAAFTLKDGLNILLFYKFKSPRVIGNGLRIEKMIKLPNKNEVAIAHLGIVPALRGKGLGSYIIEQLKALPSSVPNPNFVLDVSEENSRAKALYDRLGYKVTKHYPCQLQNKYSKVANHYRMELNPPNGE